MLDFLNTFFHKDNKPPAEKPAASDTKEKADTTDPLSLQSREVDALYAAVINLIGSDKLVIKAGKMDALQLMRSNVLGERILALQRILLENPTLSHVPEKDEIQKAILDLSDDVADIVARRSVENSIERKVEEKMEKEHQDYVSDIRREVLSEEKHIESPQQKEKREKLERLEKVHLTQSVMELLRPKDLSEIVGQDRAVKSLLSKLSSPYPQHLLLYGPPGVGKTTAARLVL